MSAGSEALQATRARVRPGLGRGLAAGLLGGLAMTFVLVLLRWGAGVPLPVELVSDRLLPQLSVRTFVRLQGRLGGPLRGKELAYVTSFLIQLVATAAGGALFALTGRRRRTKLVVSTVLFAVWVAFVALLWPALASNYRGLGPGLARLVASGGLLAAFAGYGVAVVAILERAAPARAGAASGGERGVERRRFLVGLGSGAALVVASGGLAGLLYRRATFGAFGYDGLQLRGPTTSPITPNDRFYVVTKNLIDPVVSDSAWKLQVAGRVSRPASYSMTDLTALPAVRQEQTLECISNRVGSGLISNAVWTGVRLRDLIERAGPVAGAAHVLLHAADGYTHSVSLDKAMEPTTLVAYRMNGDPLPDRHGYPARMLVPGTYGEVNVKWVDRVELSDRLAEGYYEKQGWKPYFVNTTSRFDAPRSGERISLARSPVVAVAGIAFAGDRGVSKVEVSADGGATWQEARIDYRGSRITWSLWSLAWRPTAAGRYDLVVRATDGLGAVQTEQQRGAVPAGATGWHHVVVEVTS